jgi:hypothetical protein
MNLSNLRVILILASTILIAVTLASAKNLTVRVYVPADMELAGKTVTQGEYRVEVQESETDRPMAVFYTGKREVVRAQATWVELTSPAAYDSAVTGRDDAGKTTLTKLRLKKSPRALALKPEWLSHTPDSKSRRPGSAIPSPAIFSLADR